MKIKGLDKAYSHCKRLGKELCALYESVGDKQEEIRERIRLIGSESPRQEDDLRLLSSLAGNLYDFVSEHLAPLIGKLEKVRDFEE